MGIFKAYDIRGIYPSQLDEGMARRIGHAYALFLESEGKAERRTLVVGRDMRTSAPSVQAALMEGITAAGWDVIDVGMCSTPMNYFAAGTLAVDGAVCVTASHNAGEYIGFKLSGPGSTPISRASGIGQIEELVAGKLPVAATPGSVRSEDILAAYADHVASFAGELASFRIGIDAGNGMAGHTLPTILERFPTLAVERLYFEPDGNFPNHEANPLKLENLADIRGLVLEKGLELGLAFDGDADRVAFIDGRGAVVGNDLITALIAREFLSAEPGSGIVYDLRSSWAVPEVVRAAGGRALRERVGHSFIKATMRREGAIFGGELSGHYYFRDNFYSDSAIIAALIVMRIMSASGKTLAQLVEELPRYHATGEVNFEVAETQATLTEIRSHFAGKGREVELDGVLFEFGELGAEDWWWFNLRPSNTEPLVRLNLEARRSETLDQRRELIINLLGEPAE